MANEEKKNVVLIGGGIMSATLGALIKELEPSWNIKMFETLEAPALESSSPWNNAGTGHSALCELNYTPEDANGNVDITKAVNVNEKWQTSLQYWAHLVNSGQLKAPEKFIKKVPHLSYVEGKENVAFLKKRQELLKDHPLFEGMEFSSDKETLEQWMPLMMGGRESFDDIAATYIDKGTDVNFGELTKQLFDNLEEQGASLQYKHEVVDLKRIDDSKWEVQVKDLTTGRSEFHIADFVFIGAGGGSLPLLQKTKLPESKNIGGFPVSGLFLVCQDEEIVNQHEGKVYGKAKVGAPPMSVPHLDTRYIDGKKSLLFGPFAGFSPKFLKTGSYFDLIGSVKPNNVFTMLASGAKEIPLTKYLISQLLLSDNDRIEELREFVPTAKKEDWDTIIAGQRVQVIKDTDKGKGTLMFGTETIVSEDGTVAALLGASPGASTSTDAMINVLKHSFKDSFEKWEAELKKMIPSYGKKLSDERDLYNVIDKEVREVLKIN
ncbi:MULTISPECIES: malate dehydrogenase (quinone) [unclassified Nosocomiicoccus]|uniref:malate dehydrogenase (quinone) n=1 Tax=unclassified Nosocomiicoccus TaxID=2646683 RepID=UPI0008A65705|nr:MULTISPECIES: malate dehydrogenase (quinone) [unclassified Nosocomiicoccus]OFL47209.1 malate:quinone oxidoreductase [Nosocomiicoccus sp. HMSC067E10]OFS63240.1 malate:quinone oxidoreductase [Nosocomiicoccus sp. HMSC09A07]